MEITIEETLLQGMGAQKHGRFEEAESCYRKVLKILPTHPDANHNLGILQIKANKGKNALPFFKMAVETRPEEEQFWLSYISALINEKYLNDAIKAIKIANNKGITRAKLDDFIVMLSTMFYNLGVTNHEKGRFGEAITYYSQAIEQKFNSPFAHNNLGIIFQNKGKLYEAESCFKTAIMLKIDYYESYNNLGNIYKIQNRFLEAENSFKHAIIINPEYAEAHNNLGITFKNQGKLQEAESSYQLAISLKPEYAEAYYNLGITLQEQGRFEEAELNYKKMTTLKPNFAAVHYNLGIILQELNRLDEAEASFNQAIFIDPESDKAHQAQLKCLYIQNKKTLFFDKLDYLINKKMANAVTGSFIGRSNLKYGSNRPNLFCNDPLNYVLHIDLKNKLDFEKIFVEKARLILNEKKISNRKQALLSKGYQTSGNIFEIKNEFTSEIQEAIRSQINHYRKSFRESNEGLFQKWPDEYDLYGWFISMNSGGKLQPHIHEDGWISGSVYINVPSELCSNNGKLVVSLGEDKDTKNPKLNHKKIVDVVTGSLVLFPGSLTHYTIPFESNKERIVLAFDVNPKQYVNKYSEY